MGSKRRIVVLGAGLAIATAVTIGGLSLAQQPEQSKTCGGRPANVVAAANEQVVHGTPGDDFVVLADKDDVTFDGRGGVDTVCAPDGTVEAVIYPDDNT